MTVELNPTDIASPKRVHFGDPSALVDWYGYYAGYTPAFVRDVLSVINLPPLSTVLDPWNGSGTTTAISTLQGFNATGIDISPPMTVIARARACRDVNIHTVIEQGFTLSECDSEDQSTSYTWLPKEAGNRISGIRDAIVNGDNLSGESLSSRQCVLLTALFAAVKQVSNPIRGSNPTWWKHQDGEVIDVRADEISTLFNSKLNDIYSGLISSNPLRTACLVEPTIRTGSSCNTCISSESIDAVITSPPYLTRIDYVKAMHVELTLMGISANAQTDLRSEMLGSVMGGSVPLQKPAWGEEASEVLEHVKVAARERSRSDASYYTGFYSRYFQKLFESLLEINRVLKPNGIATLVVQCSRHRGRKIDVSKVVEEMSRFIGWQPSRIVAWPTRDMGRINPKSSAYGSVSVSETALILRKP